MELDVKTKGKAGANAKMNDKERVLFLCTRGVTFRYVNVYMHIRYACALLV